MLTKLFGFRKGEHSVHTEIFAGITTFLTMAYILAVNPNILSDTGMDKGALFTTTALISCFSTILMGLYAKLPLALAPGMGLNAFFAYTVCIVLGYSWQFALTAVFIEGLIFILLTITNIREKLVHLLPDTIKKSLCAGIGLFIAFIGLKGSDVIINNDATLVSLGNLTQGSALLFVIGLILTSVLLIMKVKGGLLLGILITTVVGIPMGITKFDGILSTPPSIEPIFLKFQWEQIFTKDMFIVVFTLLFVDLFDTIGTLITMMTRINEKRNTDETASMKKAFLVDAVATTAGAMLGTSTVTTVIENAAGVEQGGKTGLTAFTTGICFLMALFFSPLFLAIPAAATGPVLVLVGLMMMESVLKVNFSDYTESIPAFVCLIMMPFAYSISEGILLGHICYVFVNALSGHHKKVSLGMYILAALFIVKYLM
ncbi:MAG: NCS2 family permease [Bacteroidales bacterium]|nr:NCS2 family permease [Bacteroidales bacterium]